jgi:peptidoglycan/xylan/chitin deacetylase (PgdA/CDA1 family)
VRKIVFFILLLIFCTAEVMAKTMLIDKFPITEKVVALTLEDVEDPRSLEDIIEICQKQAVRVTLFCPGQFMGKERAGIQILLGLGCDVGICGVKYQRWDELRGEEIWREYQLAKTMMPKEAVKEISLVRPPYDYYDESVLKALENSDQILVVRGTSIDNDINAGSIINIKINEKSSIKKLQDIIMQLKSEGYNIETVRNLLKKSGLTIRH